MFRTAAALIAKKTAIVAITGATVIGGATFALAEADLLEEEIEDTSTDVRCDDGTTVSEGETCPEPEPEPENCDLADTPDIVETCPQPEPEPENCDLADTPDIVETCPQPEPEPENCDLADTPDIVETCEPLVPEVDDEGDGQVAEHPENHGKYVSEAAKGGGECAGLTGRDKGQCVAGVAKSDIGKKGAEQPAADEPAEEIAPVVEDAPAPEVEDSVETQTAPEMPGKGNGASKGGPPAGKGKG